MGFSLIFRSRFLPSEEIFRLGGFGLVGVIRESGRGKGYFLSKIKGIDTPMTFFIIQATMITGNC